MTKDVDLETTRRAYAKWAPIYDHVYTRLLADGRRAAVRAACATGEEILEVGCGTGVALGEYPASHRVTGVDLSHPMLERAQARVCDQRLSQVRGLAVMDACRLGFRDAQFDAVVGQYMITLVPDAEEALDEFARVLRPGGSIILVNHLGAERGVRADFERAIAPLVKRMGWRAEFPVSRLEAWGKARAFSLADVTPVAPLGFFSLVRLVDQRGSRGWQADRAEPARLSTG